MNDSVIESPEAQLARWQAEEAEARARQAPPGVASAAAVSAGSGIDFFRAMLEGRMPSPPIGHALGFVLLSVQPGEAVFQGRPSEAHYNPIGSVHGGWIATLLDSCVGCAVHTTLPPGKAYTTAELKVNYVRAVTSRVPLLRAEGSVIHAGGRMATAQGRLVGHDGKLYAHASTTCFIFDAA